MHIPIIFTAASSEPRVGLSKIRWAATSLLNWADAIPI